MLKLKIENHARLPDGGPLSYQAERRGLDIGRDQHLDWTLPDPSRHVSGKHCEIRFFDGAYWLYDVSTNGTFVNKSTRRVQSPYKLADGDELLIGDYIVSVSVKGAPASRQPPAQTERAPPTRPPEAESIWAGIGEPPPPINPQDLLPPVQRQSRSADFLNSVANVPQVSTRRDEAEPSFRPTNDPWAVAGVGAPVYTGLKSEPFPGSDPEHSLAAAEPPPPLPLRDAPRPGFGREPGFAARRGSASADDFIRQFTAGANIPEEALAGRDAGELAREIGQLMRLLCANLMQLLNARAAAKTLARSGNRTLIKPFDNNPLKFTPTPEEALKIMLGPKSQSYLDAGNTVEQSFADLKAHQMAMLSAMQLAATQLLEELSPEAIEKAGGGAKKSLLGTSKAKLWEAFVERWNGKAAQHEHGMLGAFLDLFAQIYDQETRQKH